MITANPTAKVLIFDDEDIYSRLVRQILMKRNIEVLSQKDCDNLIGIIQQVNPDVILMDNNIPYIGGVEATRSIKRHPRLNIIPVIYFSSHHEIERLALEAGADTYFPKPFEIDELEKIVLEYIEVGRNRQITTQTKST
jgi:DNA-binding response OmpR family regulator